MKWEGSIAEYQHLPETREVLTDAIREASAQANRCDPKYPADQGGIKRGDVIIAYNGKVVEDSRHPGNRAAEAGMQRGDLILEVNRQPVGSVKDVLENIDRSKDKDQLLLLVQRANDKFFIPLEQQG